MLDAELFKAMMAFVSQPEGWEEADRSDGAIERVKFKTAPNGAILQVNHLEMNSFPLRWRGEEKEVSLVKLTITVGLPKA